MRLEHRRRPDSFAAVTGMQELAVLNDRIEPQWIDAFYSVFELCKVQPGDSVAILSESQSRALNVELAALALARLGACYFHVVVPTPPQTVPVPVRSTGASQVLHGHTAALESLKSASLIVDVTVEGLLHAPQMPDLLSAGTRIMMISNEHPDALERLVPKPEMQQRVKAAVKLCKASREMRVTSPAGTDLTVDFNDAVTAGVWGWTDRPGTVAHWPAGVVVSFPKAGSVNGTLVLDAGDVNLTFKRYLESPVRLTLEGDYVTAIEGQGADAELMRRYLEAWGEREAYATSHVGWGLNREARYEALTMYDQRDTNGTEVRCFAGNFLYSTGANEFAGRYTKGHFDIPVRGCTIKLDGHAVVVDGEIQDIG